MRKLIAVAASASLMAVPIAASAQSVANDLADLVGARGSSFEPEMGNRGYEFVTNADGAEYWWNSHHHKCVAATIANGRVDTLNTADSKKCGHGDGGSTVAGVLAGAAAVGLIAALSSHHKDNNSRNASDYNTEYERGYNDGLYGNNYSRNDSEAYHNGYMAGEAEKNNRKHANAPIVRGAPAKAQNACAHRGDQYWGVPKGSTVPVGVYDYGNGTYEITVASGHMRASCTTNANGHIDGFAE